MTIENDRTITTRIWGNSLPELLDKIKTFVEEKSAVWTVTIQPIEGDNSIFSKWMAFVTYIQ